MKWYKGHTVLEQLDEFEPEKILPTSLSAFRCRMFINSRRIMMTDDNPGTVAAGSIKQARSSFPAFP